MAPGTEPTKTPAQAEKERLQQEWEAQVEEALKAVTEDMHEMDMTDAESRAYYYRSLRAIKDKVAQCSPPVRKAYNQVLQSLFSDMDAIPNSMFLSEEEPKP